MNKILCIVMMGYLTLILGCDSKEPDSKMDSDRPTNEKPAGLVVTSNRLWKCPNCSKILEKGALGKVWNAGDPISRVAGTGTCGDCLSKFPQSEIYGGKYDVQEKAKTQSSSEFTGKVVVLAFRLFSTVPPSDPQGLCQSLLKQRFPQAEMSKYYVVGRTDSLTVDEALIQYKEFVQDGDLPDLGEQFDSFAGKDSSASDVVVLFFK